MISLKVSIAQTIEMLRFVSRGTVDTNTFHYVLDDPCFVRQYSNPPSDDMTPHELLIHTYADYDMYIQGVLQRLARLPNGDNFFIDIHLGLPSPEDLYEIMLSYKVYGVCGDNVRRLTVEEKEALGIFDDILI